jgi:exodeoxyribonuclease-3
VCFQETKATTVAPNARDLFDKYGYEVTYAGNGGYNGVAIASLHDMAGVVSSGGFGDEHLDREPRLVTCTIDEPVPVRIVSAYVPHGREIGHWHYGYKLAFLGSLRDRCAQWLAEGHLILGGDVNVAATNSDIFHPDAFVGLTHVTDPERDGLAEVLATGLVDLDAQRWGDDARRFTWWNHGLNYSRNLGMRIDLLVADRSLADALDTTWIDHIERGAERPSDHAALLADFDLTRQ